MAHPSIHAGSYSGGYQHPILTFDTVKELGDRAKNAPKDEERSFRDSVKEIGDKALYTIYSFSNPPQRVPYHHFCDHLDVNFKQLLVNTPETYEERKEQLFKDIERGGSAAGRWSIYCKDHVDEYKDPEERMRLARGLHEAELTGKSVPGELGWAIRYYCDVEYTELYRTEYNQKKAEMGRENIRSLSAEYRQDQQVLAEHKRRWDNLSSFERVQNIFIGENLAGSIIVTATSVTLLVVGFFLSPYARR